MPAGDARAASPHWLATELDAYRYEIGYRNPSPLAFGQATLYRADKFYAHQTVKRWLSDTPREVSDTWSRAAAGSTGWGYLVLATRFLPVHDSKIVDNGAPFWVLNVHFGLDETVKTRSAHQLLAIARELCADEPFLVAGDFNLFPDRDGDAQRAILTAHWQDLGKGARTLQAGRQVEGTFVGYEHDPFKADLRDMRSRLDHVFASPSSRVHCTGPAILYTKCMLAQEPPELSTRQLPSDHLPLLLPRIEFSC